MVVRNIALQDLPFVWKMLYQALYVPHGEPPWPEDIVSEPVIAKYLDGWGRPGDLGLIGELDQKAVGAVWLRTFDLAHAGYGYVDDDTPELSIAVVPECRGHGLGSALMSAIESQALKAGYASISLSVDYRNPARRLYQRLGYREVVVGGTSAIMKKDLR